MASTIRTLNIYAHFTTLFLLVIVMVSIWALGGWGPLYAVCMLPLVACSALCLWAACKNKAWALAFFSVILFIIGFGGGVTGWWDNYWQGNSWDWYRYLFLLAIAPGISIYYLIYRHVRSQTT